DNCPGDLIYSFSPNVNDLGVIYTCDDLGQQPVEMWVTDAAGNQDFCETFIVVQDNMGFCDSAPIAVAGLIATEMDDPVQEVMVDVNGGLSQELTGSDGLFEFSLAPDADYTITPFLDEDAGNGVTTYDLVLIQKHILGEQPLGSPYKLIAADANNSGTVSTLDMVAIRKVILLEEDSFPNNTSWRFVDADYVFPEPTNPWSEVFPEVISYNNVQEDELETDFIGVKIGDVNDSVTANGLAETDDRQAPNTLIFQTEDRYLSAGEVVDVYFTPSDTRINGYQFTLQLNAEKLSYQELIPIVADAENFGFRNLENGFITVSWHSSESLGLPAGTSWFGLRIKAHAAGNLSEFLDLGSMLTPAEAYSPEGGAAMDVALEFVAVNTQTELVLEQNSPNPFRLQTEIRFFLPEAQWARIEILDLEGRSQFLQEASYEKGWNSISLDQDDLPAGTWFYYLQTADQMLSRKMIRH
ncbi:MAG: hypothetical protein KDC34_14895, partial [Saprospiraceae bacterium]|nr:hypothetical protein [Saprospiraceae bacterium]